MFRRERPQKGRLRQFSQIGAEMLGRDDPAADAEVLLLLHDLLRDFGVTGAEVQHQHAGRSHVPARLSRRAGGVGKAHRRRAVPRLRAPPRSEPAAPARLQAAGLRRRSATPRRAWSTTRASAARPHFARVLGAARAHEGVGRGCAVHGARPRLLLPHRVRGDRRGARRAERARRRRPLRRVGAASSAGPDIAGVGFALGVERLAIVLGGEAATAAPEFVDRAARRRRPRRGGAACASAAARRRARRGRAGRTQPEESDAARRQARRPLRGHRWARTSWPAVR
mgnify:CR=1 FL=1